MAAGLSGHSALKSLSLQSNAIEDAGAVALAEALAYNTALQRLDLRDNESLGRQALVAFEELTQERPELKVTHDNMHSTKPQ